MNKQRTTLTLPPGLPEQARKAGVNMSAISADAIQQEIERIEKETGGSRQANTPAAVPSDGRA